MFKFLRHRFFWQYFLLALSILMIVSSFLIKRYFVNQNSMVNYAHQFEKHLKLVNDDFKDFILKDTAIIDRYLNASETEQDIRVAWSKPYYFFLYKDGDTKDILRFWSTSQILPDDSILSDDVNREKFAKLANGYYYIIQKRLPQDTTVTAYCLALIQSSYYIETDYLKESFVFENSLDGITDINLNPTAYSVKSPTGKTLFYLTLKKEARFDKDDEASFTLRIFGLFLFFLSIYLLLHKMYTSRDIAKDIYIFIACLLSFRMCLYFFKKSLNLEEFKLFNPELYDSGIFLSNLGDLLINSFLFCILAGFVWHRTSRNKIVVKELGSTTIKWVYSVVSLSVLVFVTLTIAGIIRGLVSNSNISFDVTNFFSLSVFTAAGFLVLAALSLGFYYFSRFLFRFSVPVFKKKEYLVYFIIALVGLLYTSLFAESASVNFYIPCIAWVLFYTAFFLNEDRLNSFFSINITGIIIWIFVFSISISMLMLAEIRKKELAQRKLYVEKLASQSDEASERVISIANKYLDSAYFIENYHRFYNADAASQIRDSIENNNYISYINNYNSTIFIFDSFGQPLNNPTSISLESFNTIIDGQSKPTKQKDLYFYETGFDKFSYITRRKIVGPKGKYYGTIIIYSDPKKFSNSEINPDLFKQYGQWELSHPSVYFYAVYKNKLLISSTRQYPFTSTISQSEMPKMRYEQRFSKEYSELWYRPDGETVVIMARKSEPLLEAITLFSYIFCSFLLLLAVINLLLLFIDWLLNSTFFRKQNIFQPTIRGQIHTTFILITLLSFIVVGIATVSFFINRFRVANNERLSRTMNIMMKEMQSRADLSKLIYQERLSLDTVVNKDQLDQIIKDVSNIHGVDVNVYDLRGNLLGTSTPDLYQRGVVGTRMAPEAYYSLMRLRSIEHIQAERISNLNYMSIYAPLRDETGALYAYLSVPYFTSQHELNQEISNFLVTLINLNAFIFLVTGLVALIITNRITRSFKLISDKMNAVSLSKKNELIDWEKDDEIGSLVKEYNKMVMKLQDSADELAATERQNAWQEMARQVAHEIKNPLTPMKLSLQYLQKAINDDRPNIEQLAENVSKTLVEQIDHLSKIATDFSQFANIGVVNKEIFDLHHTISQQLGLHNINPNVDFEWSPIVGKLNIHADKTQVNRLFSNLITNAIDACSENSTAVIKIHEKHDGGFIQIGIEDNGTGIKEEMRNKIFIPNFTTKTSGTGLGLAMSKAILEQMNGTIWFDTTPGVGTTFYFRIPLVQS